MRKAFRQADREALITLGLYGFFFVWWTVFAFGLGSGDPEEYTYVWGLPAWFFYSCVLGYPVMTLILWVVVRRFFADIPLDAPEKERGAVHSSALVCPGQVGHVWFYPLSRPPKRFFFENAMVGFFPGVFFIRRAPGL